MKNIDFDKTWIGLLLGLITPFIAFMLYYFINYHYMTFRNFMNHMKLGNTFTPIISLCVLTNLIVFYLFIYKNKYMGTRGVLASTFIWAAFILYLKFFT
ncbi:MAG: hypothetical protein Q8L90_16835 [Bacteroidota bacterium]|nr:hypothetical protein [Bacteroidota bacterium]